MVTTLIIQLVFLSLHDTNYMILVIIYVLFYEIIDDR